MITAILSAIAAFPKIFYYLDLWVGKLYNNIQVIKKNKKKEAARKAAKHAKKTKDQRKLEKALRK